MQGASLKKIVFFTAYILVNLAPVYGLSAIFLGAAKVPPLVVLAPIFLIFIPAYAYLLSLKCGQCRKPIYTVEHMKAAPGGLTRLPLHIFRRCPECSHPTDLA